LMYQGGFAQFEDPRVKPGVVTHVLCMQACLERGLDAYDLLAGDQPYKRELCDREGTQSWLTERRPRARLAHAEAVAALRRRRAS
jgi:CelD/BcsL family acetyltransferase involved in cellulose biosynthesis